MAQVLFNQFAYTDRLKAAGFTDQQARGAAEALAEALTETVATKSDIVLLRSDLGQLRSDLTAEIARAKNDLVFKILGANIALVGLLFAAVKLFK